MVSKESGLYYMFVVVTSWICLDCPCNWVFLIVALPVQINNNREECYSRVPRLSGTRYLAKGTKGNWRYTSSKARIPNDSFKYVH